MGEFDSIFADLDSSYTPGNSRQEEPESPFSSIFSDLDSSYSSIKAGEDYKAKGEAERGFFGDTVSHLARGGVGLLEATARGIETATGSETADKVGDYFRDLPRETAFLRPDESEVRGEEGVLKRGAMSAAESMPQSLSIIPAAMAGAAVGTAVAPGPGTIVGGIIGGASALGLTFGLGTYGKQKDAVNRELALTRPELTPEQRDDIAHDNALTHAQAEVGGEGVGDAAAWVIFKAVPGGSALYKGGKQILKELAAPGAMKTIGMGLLKDAPFEVGSEVGTSYFQNEADIEAGISKSTTADAMKEAIIPALFLTTGFGVTLGGMSAIERQRAYSQINSGTAEERQARVQLLAGNLAQATDKQVAKTWYDTAMGYVAAGDEIPLDVNVAELAARQPDGDAGQATQQAANHPATPDLTQDHTVSDVLATHRENLAANTVAGVLNQPESPNAVDIIPSVDNPYQRIDVPIEQQAPPAEIEQPNMEDVKSLAPHLREMFDSLVAKKEDGAPNPDFVKKTTLDQWFKKTGEDVSDVGSGPAWETLEAIRTRQPLNEKQAKVWSYLKSVAQERADLAEQGSQVIPASTSINPPADRSTGELPDDFGVQAGLTAGVQELSSQSIGNTSVANVLTGTDVGTNEGSQQGSQEPPIQSEPPPTPSKLSKEIASLRAKKEEASQPAADDERFTDMVKVLNNQTSAADLETSYQDMAGIFKERPELAQYQERFAASRDAAAEKLTPVIPSSERHEVINNTDSAAHGHEVNTAPSEAQAEAGNYKKAHVNIDGLDITVENPAGSTRTGTDKQGKSWSTTMSHDYGYIKGTTGYDKDHVDVFLAPGYQGGEQMAYVVNQHHSNGKFDEHKAVLGATSKVDAMAVYNANYEKGWTGGKSIVAMPVAEFTAWVKSDNPKNGLLKGNNTPDAVGSTGERAGSETPTVPAGVKEPWQMTRAEWQAEFEKDIDAPLYPLQKMVNDDLDESVAKRAISILKGKKVKPGYAIDELNRLQESMRNDLDAWSGAIHQAFIEHNANKSVTPPEPTITKAEPKVEPNDTPDATTDQAQTAESTLSGDVLPPQSSLKLEVKKAKAKKKNEANDGNIPGREDNSNEPGSAGSAPAGSNQAAQDKADGGKTEGSDKPTTPDKFAGNKIFTSDAVAAARARLAAKRGTFSAGFDPELIQDMLVLGGAYFESGIRGFAEWSKTVLGDIGQEFKPFLRGTYENLRYYPGIETEGISTQEEVDAHLAGKTTDTTDTTDANLESLQAELAATDAEIEELYKLRECLK